MNSIETILTASREMKNGRNFTSVCGALYSEFDELGLEIHNVYLEEPEGIDGILGEGVDVILCVIDLIYQHNPDITTEEIHNKILQKLNKWKSKYGVKDDSQI